MTAKKVDTKNKGVKKDEKTPIKKTMNDKTRYMIIGAVTAVLLALIIVLIVVGNNKKDNDNSAGVAVEDRNLSTEALVSFYEQFDSEDLNVIYYASSTCSYCALQRPILEQVVKDYGLEYYDIDISELSKTEVNEITKALGIDGSTPQTVVVSKGKVIDISDGYTDGIPYVDFFVKNGILPKGSTYKPEEKLVTISYDEFKKIAEKDETSLVLLDTSACEACTNVRKLLNDLSEKNNFKVNYMSSTTLTESEIKSLIDKDLKNLDYDEKQYKESGDVNVPLLLVLKDNKIKDYVLASTEESDYTKVLKKYGFIK